MLAQHPRMSLTQAAMRRHKHLCCWAIALCVLCQPSDVAAAHAHPKSSPIPTADQLYDRSLDANTYYSYRGREIITDWTSGHTESLIVSHLAPRLRRLDYVSPERREGLVFLSNGRSEWHYDPHRHEIDHYQLAPDAAAVADAAWDYSVLKTNYVVTVASRTQLWDNRKVYLLTISHKGTLKTARRLWIDTATGLVLKGESYEDFLEGGRQHAKLAVTEDFTTIDFHPHITRALFDPSVLTRRRGVRIVQHPAVAETPLTLPSARHPLAGDWLTPESLAGFRLVSAATTQNAPQMLHLRYSDGLNLISLFEQHRRQTRLATNVPHSRLLRIGLMRTRLVLKPPYTVINWDAPRVNLSLVGEVPLPLRTLEQLALAINDRTP
jgi:outer membrane lipoprotein-sorting protein